MTLLEYFEQPEVLSKFSEVLGDAAKPYIFTVVNYCERNRDKDGKNRLLAANRQSIESAFLLAASLGLSFDKALNECYISTVTKSSVFYATFNIGWRGLVQLCLRTDKYATIEVEKVVEGELINQDRMRGVLTFDWKQDNDERNKIKIVGYMAYFETVSGFSKSAYMSVSELVDHGMSYSDNYEEKWGDPEKPKFQAMAKKTVLKLMLEKFGPKSSDMARAMKYDQAKIGEGGQAEYIDNEGKKITTPSPEQVHDELTLLFLELDELKKIPARFYKRWQMIIEEKEVDSYQKLKAELQLIKTKLKK